jgi:protein TonB
MLAYAASRPAPVERRPHPNAMLAIIAGHVAVVALVMSAKMDLPQIIKGHPTEIFWVPKPKIPPPNPRSTDQPHQRTQDRTVDQVDQRVDVLPLTGATFEQGPPKGVDPGVLTGGTNVITELPRTHVPVTLEALLMTPASMLKPPYPESKILTGEEATLKLRLTIDESGRVIAVDPVGRADPVFLAAARKHLIANWRYRPASEDGRAVRTSMVITLRFRLDG